MYNPKARLAQRNDGWPEYTSGHVVIPSQGCEPSVIDPEGTLYDRFWQTAFERHRIWFRRKVLKLAPPWTTDPAMQRFSFTNLFRELDRGTIYYAERILKPLTVSGATDGDLLAVTTAYRLFNKVATWQACFEATQLDAWDWVECERRLRERAKDDAVFTSATMVCAYDGKPGRDKIERVCLMLGETFRDRERSARDLKKAATPSEAWERLTMLPGIGPFLAYEIYSDLLYAGDRFFKWDEDAWANAGPGCQRGLKIVWPERRDYLSEMRELRDDQNTAFKRLGLDFAAIAPTGKEHLTLRSIEHWCCEFQKWSRGNTKRKFAPTF